MAITGTSPQYDNQQTSKRIASYDMGKVRAFTFEYVNSGTAGQGTINLGTLPAGKIRVLQVPSALWVSENGSDESFVNGGTIDVGYAAYTEPDGDSVVADADYWVDGFNPAATHEQRFALPAGGGSSDEGIPKVFDTKRGLTITATIAVQDMKVGAKIYGHILFVQGN